MIAPVACAVPERGPNAPLLSGPLTLTVVPGSRTHGIYGATEIHEAFFCNYELNRAFEGRLQAHGLTLAGFGASGEARIVELPDRRFYLATLFLPQLSSRPSAPHPLIVAYLRAVAAFRATRGGLRSGVSEPPRPSGRAAP